MNQSRGAFTAQISRKRKEREDFFLHSHYHVKPKQSQSHTKTTSLLPNPLHSNRILAGFMAHEFLTKGTLLGQILDPVRAHSRTAEAEKSEVYAEVSSLLMNDGAHIPGIVNPSQLTKWINQK